MTLDRARPPRVTVGCHALRWLPLHPEQMTEEQFDRFAERRPRGMSLDTARVVMTCTAIRIAPRGGRYWNIVLMRQVLEELGWK